MDDLLYVLSVYAPYLAVVFAIGVIVGWWAESRRYDLGHARQRGDEEA